MRSDVAWARATWPEAKLKIVEAIADLVAQWASLRQSTAATVTLKVGKSPRLRSKGFTDDEAEAILHAASAHYSDRENAQTSAAKRWVPWPCALTGARMGEMGQLLKQDVYR